MKYTINRNVYHRNDIVYTFDLDNGFIEITKSIAIKNKRFLDKYYDGSKYEYTLIFKTRKQCFDHVKDIFDMKNEIKKMYS